MNIIATHDPGIIAWAANPRSQSVEWGKQNVITGTNNQQAATVQFGAFISTLQKTEPLVISAHGNDQEIGDETDEPGTWSWTANELAELLANFAPIGWTGPILISACAKTVSNFSTSLVVELERRKVLRGIWIYGYNKALDVTSAYPPPSKLDKQVDLQGAQIRY